MQSNQITLNRREAFGVLSAAAAGLMLQKGAAAQGGARRPLRGVSLAGAEFGGGDGFSCENPGQVDKAYTYPTERTIAYFAKQDMPLLRVPFLWERIQPRLGQGLDADGLKRLEAVAAHAHKHSARVVLDVHNYARYRLVREGKPQTVIIDEPIDGKVLVSRDHFADLWARLSGAFHGNPGIAAYGLMNEPHDLKGSDWKAISQAAVAAIRKQNDDTWIWVAGDSWSSAERFASANGPKAWIDDPAKRVAYEGHCYFDRDASGTYRQPYAEEAKADSRLDSRGARRVQAFAEWCKTNGVPGVIGEFGVPDDPGWYRVLEGFLAATNAANLPTCWWAAGEWWGGYPLSIQPRGESQNPAPQLAVLLRK